MTNVVLYPSLQAPVPIVVAAAEEITLDKWFNDTSQPYPAVRHPVSEGATLTDPARLLDAETTTIDRYWQPAPEIIWPVRRPVDEGTFLTDPARLLDEEFPSIDKWKPEYPDIHLLPLWPVNEGYNTIRDPQLMFGELEEVRDAFDRADNAAAIGNTDTGQAWTVDKGTAGISGNEGYFPSDSDQDRIRVMTRGDGLFSLTIRGEFGGIARIPYLTFRGSGGTSHLLLGLNTGTAVRLMKRSAAGAYTELATAAVTLTTGVDYVTVVSLSGSNVKVYIDGVLYIDHTLALGDEITYGPTAFWAGVALAKSGSPTTAARFNNFNVEVPYFAWWPPIEQPYPALRYPVNEGWQERDVSQPAAVVEEVTLDKWYQPASEPFPAARYPVAEGTFLPDYARLLDAESPSLDKWAAVYPDLHLLPRYPVPEGLFLPDYARLLDAEFTFVTWMRPIEQPYPATRWPVNEGAQLTDPARLTDEEFTFVTWRAIYPDLHLLPRYTVPEGLFLTDPARLMDAEFTFVTWWRQTEEPLRTPRWPVIEGWQERDVILPPDEIVTLDKWWMPAQEPVRQYPFLIANGWFVLWPSPINSNRLFIGDPDPFGRQSLDATADGLDPFGRQSLDAPDGGVDPFRWPTLD